MNQLSVYTLGDPAPRRGVALPPVPILAMAGGAVAYLAGYRKLGMLLGAVGAYLAFTQHAAAATPPAMPVQLPPQPGEQAVTVTPETSIYDMPAPGSSLYQGGAFRPGSGAGGGF